MIEFPVTTRLESWWSVFGTPWFEKAMATDAFSIWFQPVVDTVADRTVGYECLLRSTSGRKCEPAASNDLRGFDAYTRQLAVRAAARHAGKSIYFVNFIPAAMDTPAAGMREMTQALADSGLRPQNIVMQAVQSSQHTDLGPLRRIGQYLRERGFGFALDDVGANADAVRLLCELRPDYLKLKRGPRSSTSVSKLTEIAARLGTRVIA